MIDNTYWMKDIRPNLLHNFMRYLTFISDICKLHCSTDILFLLTHFSKIQNHPICLGTVFFLLLALIFSSNISLRYYNTVLVSLIGSILPIDDWYHYLCKINFFSLINTWSTLNQWIFIEKLSSSLKYIRSIFPLLKETQQHVQQVLHEVYFKEFIKHICHW